jgi:hypothetical protein
MKEQVEDAIQNLTRRSESEAVEALLHDFEKLEARVASLESRHRRWVTHWICATSPGSPLHNMAIEMLHDKGD